MAPYPNLPPPVYGYVLLEGAVIFSKTYLSREMPANRHS